eukprot:s704_g30.t1
MLARRVSLTQDAVVLTARTGSFETPSTSEAGVEDNICPDDSISTVAANLTAESLRAHNRRLPGHAWDALPAVPEFHGTPSVEFKSSAAIAKGPKPSRPKPPAYPPPGWTAGQPLPTPPAPSTPPPVPAPLPSPSVAEKPMPVSRATPPKTASVPAAFQPAANPPKRPSEESANKASERHHWEVRCFREEVFIAGISSNSPKENICGESRFSSDSSEDCVASQVRRSS